MTDYLEGLFPGEESALEEALERLERLLAPLPPAAAPDAVRAEGPEAPAAGAGRHVSISEIADALADESRGLGEKSLYAMVSVVAAGLGI